MEHNVNFYASLCVAMIAHVFLLHGGLQAIGFESRGDVAAQSVRRGDACGTEPGRVCPLNPGEGRLAKALALE